MSSLKFSGIVDAHVQLDIRTLYLNDLRLLVCTVLDKGVFATLIKRIENGDISPLFTATYPLEDIFTAQ